MMNYLLTILLTIVLLACNQNKDDGKTLDKIKFTHYHLWLSRLDTVDLKDSATFILETSEANGKSEYNLKSSSDDSLTVFNYSIMGDSLFYQDQYCKVIDTITLRYKGANIQLLISDFDEVDSADEESYLFWNSKYGLLGQYNWSMGPVLLFEPSTLTGFSRILYDHIVDHERSKRSN